MANKCPACHSDNPDTLKYCGECGTKLDVSAFSHPPGPEDGASLTRTLENSSGDLSRGATFAGRYEIIEELGTGGMGKVYRVFDTRIKEEVALKLLRPEVGDRARTLERFRNEIRLARKIVHKNVCRMFDMGEERGTKFITMEYVPGEDLKSFIRRAAPLNTGKAVFIAREIVEGLAEAHKHGVVHRDLKPGNIMIDKEGQAKIMDFGIAKSLAGGGTTAEGAIIGTPEYMSPEQVEGKESDERADIYALGIILFEMVTGKLPFEGETPFSIANKHRGEPPPVPKKLMPQIPEALNKLILRALEKDKTKRYQTAEDLLGDLAAVEDSLPAGDRAVPKGKAASHHEITVKITPKKLLIPGLVTAALIIMAIFVIRAIHLRSVTHAKSAKHSIAVLPFEDLSPAKDHEYLCEGIAETLIISLSNIKGLWIPAKASSFSFKGKNLGLRQIGQQLHVDNLLMSSIQVIGDKIRITPKIIHIDDGYQIWSDLYDRKMDDVFAIQDEIAREIIKALKIGLLGEKITAPIKNYTENLQAYNLYLQGRYLWNKRTAEDINRAKDLFSQAISLDPEYALAFVGLADCYAVLPQYQRSPIKDVLPEAKAAVLKALEIDETLSEAHASLASIMHKDWDWENAEEEFKRAIELNPSYPVAHQWYAILLETGGRLDEGMVEIKRALELDPLSLILNTNLGECLHLRREYDQAIRQYYWTLELDRDFAPALLFLGRSYLQKGMVEEAIAKFQEARVLMADTPLGLGDLGNAYALAGERSKAMDIVNNLEEYLKQGYSVNYDIAYVRFGLGDKNKAFECLERACDEKERLMAWFKVDPCWDNLRPDPRYNTLIRRMNLE